MNTARDIVARLWQQQSMAKHYGADVYEIAVGIVQHALQAQHKATWAMAIAAATGNCKVCVEKLPCPPLETESK